MKRFVILVTIALLATGAAQAQGWGTPSQTVRVDGTLRLQNGQIVLSNNSAVYSVPAISRYIGFIEELKEGAAVTVEGYVYGFVLTPAKLTVGGKTYDFPVISNAGFGAGCYGGCGGYGMGGGYGPMSGYGQMGGRGYGPMRGGRW
jgi:hypothetical protein